MSVEPMETTPVGENAAAGGAAAPLAHEAATALEDRFHEFPAHIRGRLQVRVPVMVNLASKKQPVSKIVELVPGSIIQFSKPCDEMLDLEVAGRRIAQGECVKVGDKFGLRITTIPAPREEPHSANVQH